MNISTCSKWRTGFVVAPVFLLALATALDAAPTRRSRRAARSRTYTSSSPQRYQSTPSTYLQPKVQPTYTAVTPSVPSQTTYTIAQASLEQPATTSQTIAPATAVTETDLNSTAMVVPSPPAVSAPTSSSGSAIAEVNAIRTRQGLPAFVEDPSLSAVAHQKAAIQANAGTMYHPGGSMGGARYEGVGMGNQFTSCYLYSNVGQYAGAATVVGRNGQRYHCLLVK